MNLELSEEAKIAVKYVNSTSQHVFLTGKAGTGKTTLLGYILDHTVKKTAVAAPTGIAAINAKGVTLHSLFQIPSCTFIPDPNFSAQSSRVHNPITLMKQMRMHETKRRLLRELELLVIDEVSMLRADLLDAIDHILRSVRRISKPFGGVQILFIGDLKQLQPVITAGEEGLIKRYYNKGFFFEAHSLAHTPPVYIELSKIYRQEDDEFIRILNNLRQDRLGEADLEKLNKHYRANIKIPITERPIYLTTHNAKADKINREALDSLPGKSEFLEGTIKGDFKENSLPVDQSLELKVGAKVMFIRNDNSSEKQFYNGKIGTVIDIGEKMITIADDDSGESIELEPYTWENTRYKLNESSQEIEEEVLGSYKQFPIRLAWAVTVHKSQGLTFDRAIIDLSDSFTPGQMYVALSRLTSLDGLILDTPIPETYFPFDASLLDYENRKPSNDKLAEELPNHQLMYLVDLAQTTFSFDGLFNDWSSHLDSFKAEAKQTSKQKQRGWTLGQMKVISQIKSTGDTFINQLQRFKFDEEPDLRNRIKERITKARDYFIPQLEKQLEEMRVQATKVDAMKAVKVYLEELQNLQRSYVNQIQRIERLHIITKSALEKGELNKDEIRKAMPKAKSTSRIQKRTVSKKKAGPVSISPSAVRSYDMFAEGLSLEEIAEKRNLTMGTIEKQFIDLLESKKYDIDLQKLVKPDRIKIIAAEVVSDSSAGLKELKEALPEEITYNDIRMVKAALKDV